MGGPSKSLMKQQNDIAQQQLSVSREAETRSREQSASMKADIEPAEKYYSGVAAGGSRLLSAIAPYVTQISTARKKTRENIYDELPAGPARDLAVAENDRSSYGDVAKVKNAAFTESIDKLANIGSGMGSFSLQNLGAGLSASSAAANTNSSVLQAQSAAKAAKMGFLGELAGAGGSFLGAKFK